MVCNGWYCYYQITEKLQGLADLHGGSYFCLKADTSLTELFGDPCVVRMFLYIVNNFNKIKSS